MIRVWLWFATLGLCLLVLFARKPDQFFHPQFWAEDGFFYQSHLQHGWTALHVPYAGYLHLVPRLIAGCAWWLDPAWVPAWFVACSAAGTIYVAGRCLSSRQPLSCRPVLALAIVCVPDAFEVLLNVTNLQWLLAAGVFILLISDDAHHWWGRVHDVGAALLLGLTGPFSVLLAPLFLARALQRKTKFSWLLAVLICATAFVQIRLMLQYAQPVPEGASVTWDYGVAAIGMRLAGSLLLGIWLDGTFPLIARWALAGVTFVLLAAFVLRRSGPRSARLLMGAVFGILLVASLYRCRWVFIPLNDAGYGARYFFPLQLILLWLIVDALSDRRGRWRWPAAVLLIVVFAVNVSRLREPPLQDLRWRDYAPRIRNGEAVVVPINPAGWTIAFPARSAKP